MLMLTLNFMADAHAAIDTLSGTVPEAALHVHMDETNENKPDHSGSQDCPQSVCQSVLLTSQAAIRIQVTSNLKFSMAPDRWAGALCSPPDRPPRNIL